MTVIAPIKAGPAAQPSPGKGNMPVAVTARAPDLPDALAAEPARIAAMDAWNRRTSQGRSDVGTLDRTAPSVLDEVA